MLRSREQRQVLLDLALTSTSRARVFVPAVTTSPPSSAPPTGDDSPASYWRDRFNQASGVVEENTVLDQARAELRHIRRRPFPPLGYDNAGELAERVVGEGEGFEPLQVAIALRCTPTFVRRSRVAAGCDPECGHHVEVDVHDPRALVHAGLSIRQASAVLGVPRSTLAGRLARA